MSQYQPANLATGVFAERAAVWLGWALLASFAVVVLFASLDTPRRAQFEGFAEVTAVGEIGPYNFTVGEITKTLRSDYEQLVRGNR